LKEDPELAMVYRLCSDEGESAERVSWLNHEPGIYELIKRVESEKPGLDVQMISDERGTDYVLVRKLPVGSSPEHQPGT
jgi:hypothetical protein